MLDELPLDEPAERGIRLVALSLLDDARAAAERLRDVSHDLRDGDAKGDEALHDFRVAVRRLRSWIRAFKPWLRDDVSRKRRRRLSAIGDATNAIRDATVHLEWLRDQPLGSTQRERAAQRWLDERLVAERAGGVRPALEAASDFAKMAEKLASRISVYCSAVTADQPPPTLGAVLGECVRKQSETLASRLAAIDGVDDVERAHKARIAAKRLRYVTEPVSTVRGAGAIIDELKALQDSLGSLHDVHVFTKELAEAAEAVAGLHRLAERLRIRGAHAYADVERRWLHGAGAPFFERVERFAESVARKRQRP